MVGWPEPYIYGVCTIFLAGTSPNIRSYTLWCIHTILANPNNAHTLKWVRQPPKKIIYCVHALSTKRKDKSDAQAVATHVNQENTSIRNIRRSGKHVDHKITSVRKIRRSEKYVDYKKRRSEKHVDQKSTRTYHSGGIWTLK